jgi:hypothetical protein
MLAPAALGPQCSRLRRSQRAFSVFFVFCCLPLRVIEHPRGCGARPAMLAPSALTAGATRLQQALRACSIFLFSFLCLFSFFAFSGPKICRNRRI